MPKAGMNEAFLYGMPCPYYGGACVYLAILPFSGGEVRHGADDV